MTVFFTRIEGFIVHAEEGEELNELMDMTLRQIGDRIKENSPEFIGQMQIQAMVARPDIETPVGLMEAMGASKSRTGTQRHPFAPKNEGNVIDLSDFVGPRH